MKQFAKVRSEFFNSGKRVVIKLITPPRISHEESYAKVFPFNQLVCGMADLEMIEDTFRTVNEAIRDHTQANPIVNTRAGGSTLLIARR